MKKYTDQEFLYRQTPVNYDGIAKFTSIKGNTLGWNQLVPPLSAMQGQNGTLSVADNVATITSSSSVSYLGIATSGSSIVLPKSEHKYLLTCEFKSSKAVTNCNLVYGSNINLVKYNLSANTWNKVSTIASHGTPTGQFVQFRIFGTFEQGDTMQVRNWNYFDLTQMGLDSITTIEEFTTLFPLPYYDYNTGTLLSFNGTGLKSASEDKSKEDTLQLPIATYYPTGMKSAGSAYDELAENKAITRIDAVNLGNLTWSYVTTGTALAPYFKALFSGIKSQGNPSVNKANILCSKYQTVTRNDTNFVDKTICADGTSTEITQIQIKDSSFTDATAFKNSLQGVFLYYELATETETDAEDIFYKFYADGTEQILPVNGATPTTAPIIADIEYYNQIEGETPYRKFWLVNGNGERWDLTEKELKSFLENPQGLGFQKTIDVTRYGERAYKNTESYNFPQVTGDVLFYDSANSTRYEKYNEFVRFLMEQPIILHYMIPVSYNSLIADTYSLECEVMSLTKTESKTDRILTSNIQMNGLGFYEGDEIEINGTANTLTINNNGDFPVGFEIELNGDFKNPYFTLEQNGELYGEAKFDDNANNFSSVFVNSKDGEQNVVLKQNNSIMPNPLAYQDLSISNGSIYVTFVKLAKGESTLTIGGDSYTISGYTIRYTPIYRSV